MRVEANARLRANASPIYVALFLSATYALQRPCVYCSILLFVLIFSVFDFRSNWFESRWPPQPTLVTLAQTARSFLGPNATATDILGQTVASVASAINGTGDSLASRALEDMTNKGMELLGLQTTPVNASAFEWLRQALVEKRAIRIPCLDVHIRL